MKMIPAIDLRDGRCVRLFQGQFDRETSYRDDPRTLASEYANLGLNHLHIVDLDGAMSGEQKNRAVVERIVRDGDASVQLGGGIRSAKVIQYWLDVGVHRVVIGTQAMTKFSTVCDWLREFGSDHLVLALDVNLNEKNEAFVASHGWTKSTTLTLNACIDLYLAAGLKHVLCTDIGRDGTSTGPNISLYESVVQKYPGLQIQASGGVRSIEDLNRIRDIGLPAAVCGRALLDGSISDAEVRSFLRAA